MIKVRQKNVTASHMSSSDIKYFGNCAKLLLVNALFRLDYKCEMLSSHRANKHQSPITINLSVFVMIVYTF